MSTASRPRNARAAANDVAIVDAAVNEILRVGVDRASLREVALRAGLTHGATYARYEDVSELLVDLWHSKLSISAVEVLGLCIHAAEGPSEAASRALLDRVRLPRPEDVAMVEMLLVSRRMPILYEEMEPFIKKNIYPEDDLTEETRVHVVHSLSLFGLVMVSVFEGHYFGANQTYLDVVERALAPALKESSAGASSHGLVNPEMARPGEEDDNLRARLVYATYLVVAKSGYHEATVSRIARRADCSPGAIYKLYRSKQDLVLDSFRAIFVRTKGDLASRLRADVASELSTLAAARLSAPQVSFAMETTIAAAHNETLQATVGAYLGDPQRHMARRGELDGIQESLLGDFVHSMSALLHGTQWMSTVMTLDTPDFDEFSESFKVALLNEWSASGN